MRKQAIFTTVESEGAILPNDLLQRIAVRDASLGGTRLEDYHLLKTDQFNEVISHSWNHLLQAWKIFDEAREKQTSSDTTFTRESWLLPLFSELGYGRLLATRAIQLEKKSYPISHSWHHVPIHLVSYKIDLDRLTRAASGMPRSSPHSLVQELLNRSDEHLWGIASNGLRLRVLRKNVSLIRQAYVEFDLEAMMKGQLYAEFVLIWHLCHQSRFEAERPEECWLEKWSHAAQDQGVRVLDQLRKGVERAIAALGSGFLAHRANTVLHEKLRSGKLNTQDYYRQVLRLVYRLIVLFVAEDRHVLLHPDATEMARERYMTYYSTARLRRLAERRLGTQHSDLYQGICLVMQKLGRDEGYLPLGLPVLNGFLFSEKSLPDLTGCHLTNHDFLEAIRTLAFMIEDGVQRAVDYKNLGSEELGSVYESLLEFHPVLNIEAGTFGLEIESGHERKTTGSYYTPTSLIESLLDSALDPVVEEARKHSDPEKAILDLKVCDPACGSGHFLIAAAHRIAGRLATIRSGDEEAGPEVRRKALRDVIGRCIYGVDINPMSVELCKVNLWKEAMEPGKPLSFLDSHILQGNSLLGTTPALLAQGIPDKAFEPIEGDDKKLCSEYRKRNKLEREGNQALFDPAGQPWDHLGNLATSMMQLDSISDDTVQGIHSKQEQYEHYVQSADYLSGRLLADAWSAAFVWKKTKEFSYPITQQILCNIERTPYSITGWMKDEIIRLREQYQFFHWHLAFPGVFRTPINGEEPENEQTGWCGGFDVILSNPPWERIKLQEKEWFALHRLDIANAVSAAQRRRMIATLQDEDASLHSAYIDEARKSEGEGHFLRNSGRYPLCGRGDVNTYAIFTENMWLTVNSIGCVGCIVPSAIITSDTTKLFFQKLIQTRSLISMYDFENSKNLFPGVGHGVFKFGLLTLTGFSRPSLQSPDFVFFADEAKVLEDENRHFTLSEEDIVLLNPNTRTCPIFRSKHDYNLIKTIYHYTPILVENFSNRNLWNAKLFTMFHMTSDARLFCTREELEEKKWILRGNIFHKDEDIYLPLYESKLVYQFNHRDATFDRIPLSHRFKLHAGTNEVTSIELQNPNFSAIPRYWVPETEVHSRFNATQWFVGFRNAISAVADARSLVAAIIPYVGVGNSMPLLTCEGNSLNAAILLAAMNSFVFDYIVRQKANGGNLSFYVFYQLPFPHPEKFSHFLPWAGSTLVDWILRRTLELTYTAWDLKPFAKDCGYAGPPFRWHEERRFLLRCELDAAYFHLYGVERDDVDYIMDTFRVWKEREEKQYGEYRTKRVILEIYDEMQKAIETGEPYQTRLDPPPADPAVAHSPGAGISL